MKTTEQSEKLHASLAQEEQNPDSAEEQPASLPQEEQEQRAEEPASSTPSDEVEAQNSATVEGSEEAATPRKKRTRKKAEQVDEQKISPRPSYWPIALAFSVCLAFVGLAENPIVLGLGVLLLIISVIGWGLERR